VIVSSVFGRRCRVGAVLLLGVLAACTSPPSAAPRVVPEPAVRPTERLHALLLNGGSRKAINYRSHLEHVQGLLAELDATGVPGDRITVFSSDGSAPAADLAVRDGRTNPDAWIMPRHVDRVLRPVQYVDSRIDGVTLRPARKAALRKWFKKEGARLVAGDTLLLYVTDHGNLNPTDRWNNTIALWNEELSVTEFREMLATLAPGVRVVMLMSQCYAGSFAQAIFPTPDASLPGGDVCGYFAATASRPAYGCYPENRGKEGVGHSFRFIEALGPLGSFPEANRRVLVSDRTPDVPHRTSDFFLRELLRERGKAADLDLTAFADRYLERAWRDRGAWEPQIRLLDRVGHSFGSFSPRTLAELETQARVLPEFSTQLETYADRWKSALDDLKGENFRRFLEAHPVWKERLTRDALAALDDDGRRAAADELLAALTPYTRADAERFARMESLRTKADNAGGARYRAEVRLGVVLRMRMLLRDIAGRTYLRDDGTPEERAAFERLQACESLTLDATPAVALAAELESPEPYPPLAEERLLVESVTPAWMGIRYRQLTDSEHTRFGTHIGAVKVVTVYEEHPAAAALRVGDIVLGPPDAPFEEPHHLREWTMRREIGVPTELAILREERPQTIALRLAPFPIEVPELPGPPQVGSLAPTLDADLYRGGTTLVAGKPRLLFFWATWCLICKNSLPEVLAFGAARDVEVVAITDEDPETLDKFFGEFSEPFPTTVAVDLDRVSFLDYGVSGLPTFVLVDEAGTVQHYQSGYGSKAGLGVDGWTWSGRKTATDTH
jgi:thiol-disulfide isomerase/thioredoxin